MTATRIDPALTHLAVPIDSVQTHPRNPRLGSVEEIAQSLARFGQVRPILVQKSTGYVVAGNHTRKAAIELGFTEIAAVVIEIDDDEATAYLLADNRLGDKGGYDDAALVEILKELSLAGRLEGTGYSEADVEELLDLMDQMPTVHPSEMVKAEDLTAHPRNPKTHSNEQVEHIGRSLAEHGFYRQVVIANDGTILAGHGLVQAAQAAGLKRVPAVRMPYGPDDPEALKILAGDNAIGDLASLDRRELSEMLREVKESGDASSLLGTGFDPATLANLVYVSRPESEIQDANAAAEWVGMPEFEAAGPRVQLMLAFETEAQRDELVAKLELIIAKKNRMTWSAWWPPREQEDLSSLVVERDVITFEDDLGRHERTYVHAGCEGRERDWTVKIEADAPPVSGETRACAYCSKVLDVVPARIDEPEPEDMTGRFVRVLVDGDAKVYGKVAGSVVDANVGLAYLIDHHGGQTSRLTPAEVEFVDVEEVRQDWLHNHVGEEMPADVAPTPKPKPRAKRKPKAKPAASEPVAGPEAVPNAPETERVAEQAAALVESGAVPTPEPKPEPVPDLMAALEESLAGVKPETSDPKPATPEPAATAAVDALQDYLCGRCGELRQEPVGSKPPVCDGPPDQDPHPEQQMTPIDPQAAAEMREVYGDATTTERKPLVEFICPVCEYVTEAEDVTDEPGGEHSENGPPLCTGHSSETEHQVAAMLKVMVHHDQVPR